MKKLVIFICCGFTAVAFARMVNTYAPGVRVQMLAHNAYPDHGKYADRLDHAIAAGVPFVVEEDLSWTDGKSLIIHGKKNVAVEDPTLDTYFFPKIKPLMEQALKEGNKNSWPLVTLYLDIKNDPPEHLEAINKMLDQYDAWLTTAVKTSDMSKQSPLDLKPMMVLVEDKQNDNLKQKYFYDDLPVGGKIRVFGSVSKPDPNPGKKLPKQEAIDRMASVDPEQIVTAKADNYHRWWGSDWAYIEKGGEAQAGDWTKEDEKRLKHWVSYGHQLGYFVSFYCLDGFDTAQDQGWDAEYNFGNKEAVMKRWQATARAKADFIATDQYEELARVIHSAGK